MRLSVPTCTVHWLYHQILQILRDPDTLLQVKTFSESFLRHVTDAGKLATGLTTPLTFNQIETTPNNNFSIDIIVVWLTWPH